MLRIIPMLFIVLFLTGCTALAKKDNEAFFVITDGHAKQNKQQNLSLGRKTYEKDFNKVFTAVITGLSDLGFSVKNMERQSGYILAEGPNPLSGDEQLTLATEFTAQLNKKMNYFEYHPVVGKETYAITVQLRKKKAATYVKMRVATLSIGQITTGHQASSIYPPTLSAIYKSIWMRIDRQIFLDEGLD